MHTQNHFFWILKCKHVWKAPFCKPWAVRYPSSHTWQYNATLFKLCVHNLIAAKLWQWLKIWHCRISTFKQKSYSNVKISVYVTEGLMSGSYCIQRCSKLDVGAATPLPANHLQTGWEQALTQPCGSSGFSVSPMCCCFPFTAICQILIQTHISCNVSAIYTHSCLLETHLTFHQNFLSREQEASSAVSQKFIVKFTRKTAANSGVCVINENEGFL